MLVLIIDTLIPDIDDADADDDDANDNEDDNEDDDDDDDDDDSAAAAEDDDDADDADDDVNYERIAIFILFLALMLTMHSYFLYFVIEYSLKHHIEHNYYTHERDCFTTSPRPAAIAWRERHVRLCEGPHAFLEAALSALSRMRKETLCSV